MSKLIERIKELDEQIQYFDDLIDDEAYNNPAGIAIGFNLGTTKTHTREDKSLTYGDYEVEMELGAYANLEAIMHLLLENLQATRSHYIKAVEEERDALDKFLINNS